MATYNKRGYKTPKEKEEKLDNNFIEDTPNVDEKDSTTAKAFDTLDQGASKIEDWVAKNQKYILNALLAVVIVTVGYLSYQKQHRLRSFSRASTLLIQRTFGLSATNYGFGG